MKRESFIFYKSFYESIKELEPLDQVQIYNAIFNYQFEGEESELKGICKSIFTLIIPQLEANNKRYLNGLKGGAPKGNRNATKKQPKNNLELTKKQPNENENENDNENVNVNDNVTTNNNIYDFIEEKYDNKIFEKFWNEYPKKISKGNAEKWFKKNKPTNDLVDLMIEKLKIYKETEQWKKDNGKYIPYPSSWLNAKGWEDEIQSNNIKQKYDTSIVYHDKYIGDYKLDENGRRIFV